MASKLTASLDGSILVQLAPGVCLGPVDPGLNVTLALTTANRTGDEQVSQQLATIDSPAAFVALPYPGSLLGRVLYLRGLGERDAWLVRVSYAASAQAVIPVQGMVLVEAPIGDEITGLEVQGVGELTWVVWGVLA